MRLLPFFTVNYLLDDYLENCYVCSHIKNKKCTHIHTYVSYMLYHSKLNTSIAPLGIKYIITGIIHNL